MKEGEVIYIMYNGINSGVPDTLLFSGKEHGKREWERRNSFNPVLPKHIELWINKEQLVTSSFLVGFLEEFANNKTPRELFGAITVKVTPSIPDPQDRKYISELVTTVESELRRALVRLAAQEN